MIFERPDAAFVRADQVVSAPQRLFRENAINAMNCLAADELSEPLPAGAVLNEN